MFNIPQDFFLSKNFKISEFVCKDGSNEVLYDPELIVRLQALRDRVKKPILVVSGYRTAAWNAAVGGAPKSQHLYGKAADIKIEGMTPLQVAYLAEKVGFTGIGVYRYNNARFTHVDVRLEKSYWMDKYTGGLVSIKYLREVK